LLLPRSGGFYALYQTLSDTLTRAAERAGCSQRVTPHRLRHTFASEMLRLGVSLPALMQTAGTQRHPHDPALSASHSTGPAA
jgi:site-specific recombinase XerD